MVPRTRGGAALGWTMHVVPLAVHRRGLTACHNVHRTYRSRVARGDVHSVCDTPNSTQSLLAVHRASIGRQRAAHAASHASSCVWVVACTVGCFERAVAAGAGAGAHHAGRICAFSHTFSL